MKTFPTSSWVGWFSIGLLLFALPPFATAQTIVNEPAPVGEPAAEPPQQSFAAPYQFSSEGIFGCNQTAGALGSAGTMAAIGGVYVPVNDAAVTLNTGILVYKECILRPLQDRFRESVTAGLLKKLLVDMETGRQGNKQYVVEPISEALQVSDREVYAVLTDPNVVDKLHKNFGRSVISAVASGYQKDTRSPEKDLECSYKGNLDDLIVTGDVPNPLEGIRTLALDPACNPFEAFLMTNALAEARVEQAVSKWASSIDRGFYPVTDNADDPLAEKILTPASVVQSSFQKGLDAPQDQLNFVTDIGQLNGTAITNVAIRALSDITGMAGFMQNGYLDQIARESSQGVVSAAVNAALTILNAARQIEGSYLAVMNAVASKLTQTINQIRSIERQCWALVVPSAQTYASQNGFTLDTAKISAATSSLAFSQQVIDAQITPLAQSVLSNVQSSQKALALIEQLIAGVTNTTSLSAQRLALQQLDALVAQKQLHSQYDVQNATKQRDDVAAATENLVNDTKVAWADSPDASVGWCNINNPSIPQLWAERWKK